MKDERLQLFSKFTVDVIKAIEERFPEAEVELRTVTKLNGIQLHGICANFHDGSAFPTVYLDQFFEECDGEVNETIIDKIQNIIKTHKIAAPFDISWFTDYDNVREKILVKIVNTKLNEEYLKTVPHRSFMDLSIIPVFHFPEDKPSFGKCTITITNKHLERWEVTVDEVISDAVTNTFCNLTPHIDSMFSVLAELNPSFAELELTEEEPQMYVAKTSDIHGANVMLFQDSLYKFAKSVNSDLYILPSSIHEVLIIPVTQAPPMEQLSLMVTEVNESELATEDILSDHVYYYSMDSGYRFPFE